MKKLTFLLLFLSTQALAQEWTQITGTVTCGPLRSIIQTLGQEKYKEQPLWVGQSNGDATRFVLFLNADRGNFTVVQYYKERACILGMGDSSNIVNLAPFQEKQ